jgi:hypothetical protein
MKGWPKGKLRGPIPEAVRSAISAGQRARWADPQKRETATAGSVRCWQTGARSRDRIEWTPEMDAALRDLHATHKFTWMRTEGTDQIGVGEHAIRDRMKTLGLRRMGRGTRPEEISRMERLHNLSRSWTAIAKIVGRSPQTVSKYLSKLGLQPPYQVRKFTAQEDATALAMRAACATYREIAAQIECSITTVRKRIFRLAGRDRARELSARIVALREVERLALGKKKRAPRRSKRPNPPPK